MNKYRIHIDPPSPSRERIQRYQDFDSLYDHYQTHTRFEFWRNLYRKPRNFAVLVLVATVGALVFQANETSEEPARPYRLFPAQVRLDLPSTQLALPSDAPHTLSLTPQVSLQVPAQPWQDSSGGVVSGPVQLHYRTLRQPAELYLAGVPHPRRNQQPLSEMHLLEVYATQANQRLFLREGYALGVSWNLPQQLTEASVQQLDANQGAWLPIPEVNWTKQATPVPPRPSRPAVLDQQADTLVAKGAAAPQAPRRPFGVKVQNPEAYPEFKGYAKVYWEHVPRRGTVNPWQAGLIDPKNGWEDVAVRRLPRRDLYELRFTRTGPEGGLEVKRVTARPLFEASNEAEAQAIWAERQARYRVAATRATQADSLRVARQAEVAAIRRRYADALATWEAARARAEAATATYQLRYDLSQLGVSGFWQVQPAAGEGVSLQLTQPGGEPLRLTEDLLPWCYAVQGDRWLPVRATDAGVEVMGAPPFLLWWTDVNGLSYRYTVLDTAKALRPTAHTTLAAFDQPQAWMQWLRADDPR